CQSRRSSLDAQAPSGHMTGLLADERSSFPVSTEPTFSHANSFVAQKQARPCEMRVSIRVDAAKPGILDATTSRTLVPNYLVVPQSPARVLAAAFCLAPWLRAASRGTSRARPLLQRTRCHPTPK